MKNVENLKKTRETALKWFKTKKQTPLVLLIYASLLSNVKLNWWLFRLRSPELARANLSVNMMIWDNHSVIIHFHSQRRTKAALYLCVMQLVSHWTLCFWSLRLTTVTLKKQFIQKWKFSHYLHGPMQMESQRKFFSPQNVSGAWQQITAAAFSGTTEVDGDLSGVIQVSSSPETPNWFVKTLFTPCVWLWTDHRWRLS